MAKLRGNLFGNFQGKLGLAYGRMVHGVNLGANMPVKRGNEKGTQQMYDQQKRFALLAVMASGFMTAINLGLKAAAKSIGPLVSSFDAFIKLNAPSVHIEAGTQQVEYGSLIVAKGNLPQVGFTAADFSEPLQVSVSFTPNTSTPGADANDDVYITVLEPESNMTVTSAAVKRSVGSIEMALPSTWSGMTVHVYGFAVNAEGKASHSAFIATGNVG